MYLRGDKMTCLLRKPLSRRQGGLSRLRGCSEQACSGVRSRGVVGGHSLHISGVCMVKGDAGSPSTSAHVFCQWSDKETWVSVYGWAAHKGKKSVSTDKQWWCGRLVGFISAEKWIWGAPFGSLERMKPVSLTLLFVLDALWRAGRGPWKVHDISLFKTSQLSAVSSYISYVV